MNGDLYVNAIVGNPSIDGEILPIAFSKCFISHVVLPEKAQSKEPDGRIC